MTNGHGRRGSSDHSLCSKGNNDSGILFVMYVNVHKRQDSSWDHFDEYFLFIIKRKLHTRTVSPNVIYPIRILHWQHKSLFGIIKDQE